MASIITSLQRTHKLSVSITDLTSELQTHLSSCVLDISVWISLTHLKFGSFKIKFILSLLPKLTLPSMLTILENDNYHPNGYQSHPLQPIKYSQLQVLWILLFNIIQRWPFSTSLGPSAYPKPLSSLA